MTSRRGPLRRRRARSMPPTTTASMLLKSCAMPPVSWPTASIFWTWRSWASAACALGGFGLQRLVRLPQFLGPFAHRLLERLGALGLAFRLARARRRSGAAPGPRPRRGRSRRARRGCRASSDNRSAGRPGRRRSGSARCLPRSDCALAGGDLVELVESSLGPVGDSAGRVDNSRSRPGPALAIAARAASASSSPRVAIELLRARRPAARCAGLLRTSLLELAGSGSRRARHWL